MSATDPLTRSDWAGRLLVGVRGSLPVAGNDGYTWPGYAGPGWVPPGQPEPAPADPEPGDGQGTPDADQETAGPVGTGQWVRRGHRIVVLGV